MMCQRLSRSLRRGGVACICILTFFTGCQTASYVVVPSGTLPSHISDWNIRESPHFPELSRTYGNGTAYERAKIKYLLGHASMSPFSFDRNGYVYDGKDTAKHLTKKYKRDLQEISTARDFINNVASISNTSRRAYFALPGDGKAYRTGDILHYELKRLETFMDGLER